MTGDCLAAVSFAVRQPDNWPAAGKCGLLFTAPRHDGAPWSPRDTRAHPTGLVRLFAASSNVS